MCWGKHRTEETLMLWLNNDIVSHFYTLRVTFGNHNTSLHQSVQLNIPGLLQAPRKHKTFSHDKYNQNLFSRKFCTNHFENVLVLEIQHSQ